MVRTECLQNWIDSLQKDLEEQGKYVAKESPEVVLIDTAYELYLCVDSKTTKKKDPFYNLCRADVIAAERANRLKVQEEKHGKLEYVLTELSGASGAFENYAFTVPLNESYCVAVVFNKYMDRKGILDSINSYKDKILGCFKEIETEPVKPKKEERRKVPGFGG